MRKIFFPLISAIIGATCSYFFPIKAADPTVFSNVLFSPFLDISYFGSYLFSVDISPTPISASVTFDEITDGVPSQFHYCADGTGIAETDINSLFLFSGIIWHKNNIRPDDIYPSIVFSPTDTTYNTPPNNTNVRRQNYQIMHFINPLATSSDMNFWIEINASPVSTVNSSDLLVYLVKKGKNISFFNQDWRVDNVNTELVGTINKNTPYSHTHTLNSGHHLIHLTANADRTIGVNHLDVSQDFWVVIYDNSPNISRGWNLKYQTSSICSTPNLWYVGNITGWTATPQSGYPDVHVHFARRTSPTDGLKAVVNANGESFSTNFSFAPLPNLAPNTTTFNSPVTGVYSGNINVDWNASTDPNTGDIIAYNLYLVDSSNKETLLTSGLSGTGYLFNTISPLVSDGIYSLRGESCDASLCTNFISPTFSINNTISNIYSLTTISKTSNGSNPARAKAGDTVTLYFSSTGTINTPSVSFYSGGNSVKNAPVLHNSGNNWTASYVVDPQDTIGQITFILSSTNLDYEYTEITTGTYVIVYSESPVSPIVNPVTGPTTTEVTPCQGTTISDRPNLFQIDVNSSEVILYYSPVSGQISDYYVSYGKNSQSMEHGSFTKQGNSSGVLSFKISHLNPNTDYYFRIRAYGGCVPGEWSNELKVTTRKGITKKYTKNYKNIIYQITRPISSFIQKPTSTVIEKPAPSVQTPKITPTENPQVPDQKRKKCFLWFCW